MQKSLRQELKQTPSQKLFGTDVYDFLETHSLLNETGPAVELGVTKRDIESLKQQMRRG